MLDALALEEKKLLLHLARQSIELAASGQPLPRLNLDDYSPRLQAPGASFVTLTAAGELRGCIGTLEAHQPLVQDVCEHAAAAAREDYRFTPVDPNEVAHLKIEISRLSAPQPLDYNSPEDLLEQLRPGVDGVVIRDGLRRATFLPQVWEKLPDKEIFMAHLCQKMGVPLDWWRKNRLKVEVYQVEEFHEE